MSVYTASSARNLRQIQRSDHSVTRQACQIFTGLWLLRQAPEKAFIKFEPNTRLVIRISSDRLQDLRFGLHKFRISIADLWPETFKKSIAAAVRIVSMSYPWNLGVATVMITNENIGYPHVKRERRNGAVCIPLETLR